MEKVVIMGAGRVGETTAQFLAEQELCREVVLIDIREDAPQGVVLDILQTAPFFRFDTEVRGQQRSGRHGGCRPGGDNRRHPAQAGHVPLGRTGDPTRPSSTASWTMFCAMRPAPAFSWSAIPWMCSPGGSGSVLDGRESG